MITVSHLWVALACTGCGKHMSEGDRVFARRERYAKAWSGMYCGDCIRPFMEEDRRVALMPRDERDTYLRDQRVKQGLTT